MHVGQAIVAAAVVVRQLFVIEAHLVQDRGVQIMDVDAVLHGVPAEIVGRAVRETALALLLDSASRNPPRGKTERMMFAVVYLPKAEFMLLQHIRIHNLESDS